MAAWRDRRSVAAASVREGSGVQAVVAPTGSPRSQTRRELIEVCGALSNVSNVCGPSDGIGEAV